MQTLRATVVRFLGAEDGPTAVEYAVMLGFIITVCIGAIQMVGANTNVKFNNPTLKTALTGS